MGWWLMGRCGLVVNGEVLAGGLWGSMEPVISHELMMMPKRKVTTEDTKGVLKANNGIVSRVSSVFS